MLICLEVSFDYILDKKFLVFSLIWSLFNLTEIYAIMDLRMKTIRSSEQDMD